jgi:hypothetical protein
VNSLEDNSIIYSKKINIYTLVPEECQAASLPMLKEGDKMLQAKPPAQVLDDCFILTVFREEDKLGTMLADEAIELLNCLGVAQPPVVPYHGDHGS